MDGNGRWAGKRGLPRIEGHRRAIESVRAVTTELVRRGDVRYLTLYAFSSENWKRPRQEVGFLMRLLARFCRQEVPTMMKNNVRLTTIGSLRKLPTKIRDAVRGVEKATERNDGLTLCLALSYGARDELVRAARRAARDVAWGRMSARAITETRFSSYLDTAEIPDPDLLIRTAGEMRLSNFLLWQASYAELWFTDVCWPDFRESHLNEAIDAYSRRTRRFGGLESGDGRSRDGT